MIFGDKAGFAIESSMTQAYERPSFIGLGSIQIHLEGTAYGVDAPDATLLACSLDEVRKRLRERGLHIAPFSKEAIALDIAKAFRFALYSEELPSFALELPLERFREPFSRDVGNCTWAPDGDEGFDDGSFVLQFDIANEVRLIGFKSSREDVGAVSCVTDFTCSSDHYYGLLSQWEQAFVADWKARLGAA